MGTLGLKQFFAIFFGKISGWHRLWVWLTYLVALAALYWVFHDVDWDTLLAQVEMMSWPWVAAIVVLAVVSFYVQGVRWQLLLKPAGQIARLKTTQAIYVGQFSSELLPLRAGEVIRGVLVARWLGRKFRDVLPSMAVERLLDALWFSLAMALVALLVPVPPQIRTITFFVLALGTVGMALFAWNAIRRRERGPVPVE